MKHVLYIPGSGTRSNTLRHIATKCGHCDDNSGETGGGNGGGTGNKNPKSNYVIRPEPNPDKRDSALAKLFSA